MISDQLSRIQRAIRRAAPGPLVVRGGIAICASAALVTAYPWEILATRAVLLLALLAVLPMLAPRGRWVTIVVLATVCGWLISTMGYAQPVTLSRVFVIAAALYLTHSLAALASVLPYDVVVAPEVLGRWIGRALLVVAASAVLSLVVVVIGAAARGANLLASLAGLAVAVAVTALLAHLLRGGEDRRG